jgi:hypothetical protein
MKTHLLSALFAVVLTSFLSAAPPGTTFELVAETGAAVPGMPGVTFASLGTPRLNAAGDVAFRAVLSGTGVGATNDEAIFIRSGNALNVAVIEGGAVDDLPGQTLSGFSEHFNFTDDGEVILIGALSGAGVDASNDGGVFVALSDGSVRTLAREGDSVGATGLVIGAPAFERFAVGGAPPLVVPDRNGDGEPDLIAFRPGGWVRDPLVPGSDRFAMLFLRDGEINVGAQENDVISSVAGARLAAPLALHGPFRAEGAAGPGSEPSPDFFYSTQSSSIVILRQNGANEFHGVFFPGNRTPDGTRRFSSFGNLCVDSLGDRFSFTANIQKPNGAGASQGAYFAPRNGSTFPARELFERNAPVPGKPSFKFGGFDRVALDPFHGGRMLFGFIEKDSTLAGSAFIGGRSALRYIVARSGGVAPDLPDGSRFTSVQYHFGIGASVVKNRAYFFGGFDGPGATPQNNRGLFFSDLARDRAKTRLLVRIGETIQFDSGATRTLADLPNLFTLNIPTGTAGDVRACNAVGHVTFAANFGLASGIIFAAPPAPLLFQPDIKVKSVSGLNTVGEDVYGTSPNDKQKLLIEMARGDEVEIKVTVQNDGTARDSFDVSGKTPAIMETGPNMPRVFIARVFDANGTEISGQMLHPKGKQDYPSDSLDPGGSQEFTFRIKVPASLDKNLLTDGKIKIRLKAVSRNDPEPEEKKKAIDTFDIIVKVTNP